MIYDPKWEVETKADPLTLESLIAWLEKQPAEKKYCYMHDGICLAAQYNQSIGRKYETYIKEDGSFDAALELIASGGKWTFGAALERARAAALSKGESSR